MFTAIKCLQLYIYIKKDIIIPVPIKQINLSLHLQSNILYYTYKL